MSTLQSRFRPIVTSPKLGNVLLLVNDKGVPVHAAVYIADDLVFTKNGYGIIHPWTFMKIDAMTGLYTSLAGKLRVVYVAADSV